MAQLAVQLPTVQKVLGSIPSTTCTGHVMDVCNANTQEMVAGGSEIQGHPWLDSEYEASLDYTRPCLKKKKAHKYCIQHPSGFVYKLYMKRT